MPIFYQFEHPDYGWLTYDLDGVLDEIRNDIEANNLSPDTLNYEVRVVEMSQSDYDALPLIEM